MSERTAAASRWLPPGASVKPGLDVLLSPAAGDSPAGRAGLLAHPASVNSSLQHAIDVLRTRPGLQLTALFAPEHGLRGEAQDMERVAGGVDPATGLPLHSLYGSHAGSLAPTDGMLAGLDLLICDLQDVGARYYTFVSTLALVMERAAHCKLKVVILDRPNPLGGEVLEGPGLEVGYHSFVGHLDLPVRHGLTMGEMGRLINQSLQPPVDLEIVLMTGWRRDMTWCQTGLIWVPPSPNMPTAATSMVYPGACLLEGTNLSEGRGTTRPFEVVGAPWLDGAELAREMNRKHFEGVLFRAHSFRPQARKWQGEVCHGVQVHVTDASLFRSFPVYVALLSAMRHQSPQQFAWRTAAYEFETERLAIDLLAGSARLRLDLEAGRPLCEMTREWESHCRSFARRRAGILLYGPDAAPVGEETAGRK